MEVDGVALTKNCKYKQATTKQQKIKYCTTLITNKQ